MTPARRRRTVAAMRTPAAVWPRLCGRHRRPRSGRLWLGGRRRGLRCGRLLPGVSIGVGVGSGGVNAGVTAGSGPVGVGVGVNQQGQVTGGVGVGVGTEIGNSGVNAGVGVGTGTVLYDPNERRQREQRAPHCCSR